MRLFSSVASELGLRAVRLFEKLEKATDVLAHIPCPSTGIYAISEASWAP